MWGYIVAFVVGAAVPIFINWTERKDKLKQFDLERKDKYKLVAIEKRLEAHQQAYKHFALLIEIIHESDINIRANALQKAREFFFEYSIFLEKETRQEFYATINRVSDHQQLIRMSKSLPSGGEKDKARERINENWESIYNLGGIIQREVELEPIVLEPKFDAEGNEEGV